MKASEAIEILEGDTSDLTIFEVPDFLDAIKLGIEALKGITAIRCGAISDVNELLPGETPEKEVIN